jgi:hypothetical protein
LAVAAVTGLVTNSQIVAAASTVLTTTVRVNGADADVAGSWRFEADLAELFRLFQPTVRGRGLIATGTLR